MAHVPKNSVYPSALLSLALVLILLTPLSAVGQSSAEGAEVGEASYNIADCSPVNKDEDAKTEEDTDSPKLDLDECKKLKK